MQNSTLPDFQDIRISVPWGHVEGRWYGNRNVRPILAIHGWLDNLGTWDTIIPLLPTHVGILCIDLPGHGRSSKYPKGMTYHVMEYVHMIPRIMNEYKWKKVSLLGHSMGALICFIYTAMYPHSVDLIMQIDIIKPNMRSIAFEMALLHTRVEKTLIEDERLDKLALHEPPSYSYEELERLLYEGSGKSVDLENCKYILNRSITKSDKYPDKYYFSRDGKVKYYVEFQFTQEVLYEMAKRIRNIPYLVVKGSKSHFIIEDSIHFIKLLRENNPHFEFYIIEGTHHVHLNNPKDVAAVLKPFIHTHRPAVLSSWSVDDENFNNGKKAQKNGDKKKGKGPIAWLKSKL